METERDQILREFRAELAEIQKEFHGRISGLMTRIAHELGEVKPGPSEIMFSSPYRTSSAKRKVKCGRL